MPVQLTQEERTQAKKKSHAAPWLVRRLGSIRVSYGFVLAVVCWLVYAVTVYTLRLAGVIEGR